MAVISTSSNHRAWSRFNFQLSFAHPRPRGRESAVRRRREHGRRVRGPHQADGPALVPPSSGPPGLHMRPRTWPPCLWTQINHRRAQRQRRERNVLPNRVPRRHLRGFHPDAGSGRKASLLHTRPRRNHGDTGASLRRRVILRGRVRDDYWAPGSTRFGISMHRAPTSSVSRNSPDPQTNATQPRCVGRLFLHRCHLPVPPFPPRGLVGSIPPLRRYYETLRLLAVHPPALRCLRPAVPSEHLRLRLI